MMKSLSSENTSNQNIILIGMPTSGKSTAGVILAKIMGLSFVDTDLLIQGRSGRKLHEIISQDGLDAFLALEEEVCLSLKEQGSVIATGGSVVYGQRAREHLKELGVVVYLDIDFDTLERRLHNVKQRGVVLREGQTIRDLYEERRMLYAKYADITVSEAGLDMEQTVDSIRKGVVIYQSRKEKCTGK